MSTSATDGHPMRRRSWYLPQETAEALAAVIEDLHFSTRRPKHEVLAATVAVALEHRSDIEERLTGQDATS